MFNFKQAVEHFIIDLECFFKEHGSGKSDINFIKYLEPFFITKSSTPFNCKNLL